MPAQPIRLRSVCPHCDHCESLSELDLQSRLRKLGMLKRAGEDSDQRDIAYLLQLAQAARERLLCHACGSGGLTIEPAPDDDEWGAPAKPCAACGAMIPSERLELFPESELCAACQQRIDRGQTPDAHDDFCPRCGTRMTVRQRRGSGIAGYEMICPACRR